MTASPKQQPLRPPVNAARQSKLSIQTQKIAASAAAEPVEPNQNQPRRYYEPDWIMWQRSALKKTTVFVEMSNGCSFSGRILRYGAFTVEIQDLARGAPIVLFKHSMAFAYEVPNAEVQNP